MVPAATIAFAALALAGPALTAAKKVSGKGPDGKKYEYIFDVVPEMCKAHSPVPCTGKHQWHKHGKSEYYYAEKRMDFAGAKAFCQAEAFAHTSKGATAQLVSINSDNEARFVISLQENNRHGFWLGADRSNDFTVGRLYGKGKARDGFDKFVDGTVMEYTSWAPGEPNSDRNQRAKNYPWNEGCVFSGLNKGHPGMWNDATCDKLKRVVCERPFIQGPAKCYSEEDPLDCMNYYSVPNNKCSSQVAVTTTRTTTTQTTKSTIAGFRGAAPTDPTTMQPTTTVKNIADYGGKTYADYCSVRCGGCRTTTTTAVATTSTTEAPTTITSPAATTTTTEAPSTTTSPARTTTTSPAKTTSTTAAPTTTTTGEDTTTTTGPDTTTTTVEPTTTFFHHGACDTQPWKSVTRSGLQSDTYGETHCCYKYHPTPRKTWRAAEATCNAYHDQYQVDPNFRVTSNLATPTDYAVVEELARIRFCKSSRNVNKCMATNVNGKFDKWRTSDSTWIGGKLTQRTVFGASNITDFNEVKWSNPWQSEFDYRNVLTDVTRPPWYNNEPSHFADRTRKPEACLAMGSSNKQTRNAEGSMAWNDAQCSLKKGFFCEYCLTVSTTTTGVPTTTTTAAPTTTSMAASTTTTEEPTTTTTMAASTTTTGVPTTTTTGVPTTTTTPEPRCEDNTCAKNCGMLYEKKANWVSECGWSKSKKLCIAGGRTTKSEIGLGDCNAALPAPTDNGVTASTTRTTRTKEMDPEVACELIDCSNDCGIQYTETQIPKKEFFKTKDEFVRAKAKFLKISATQCGWSSKYGRCKLGGTTKAWGPKKSALNPDAKNEQDEGPGCPCVQKKECWYSNL